MRVGEVARRRGVSVNALVLEALEGVVAFEREPQGVTPRVPERVPEVAAVDVAGKRAQVDALLARSGGKVFRGPDFRGGKAK